jgi:SulP family sulfate permease
MVGNSDNSMEDAVAVFKCPECDFEKRVADDLDGRAVRCPVCGEVSVTGESLDLNIDQGGAQFDEISSPEDICPDCGATVGNCDTPGTCPNCGGAICMPHEEVTELPDPEDNSVDLSDLVDESGRPWEPQEHPEEPEGLEDFQAAQREEQRGRVLAGGWFSNIFAGIVSGLLGYVSALCMGLLVGSQADGGVFLANAAAMALVSACVGGFLFSLRSRIPFALAGPESVLCGVTFLYAGALYSGLQGGPADSVVPTLTAGIVTAGICAGLTLYALGRVGAGVWVRYTPVQVIGGVVGGIGFFIVLAALSLMTGDGSVPHAGLSVLQFMDWDRIATADPIRVLPPVAFGFFLYILSGRFRNSLWLLCVLVATLIGVQALELWGQDSLWTKVLLIPAGLPVNAEAFHSEVLSSGFWSRVQWQVILDNAYFIGALMAIAFIKVTYRGTLLEAEVSPTEGGVGDFESVGLANFGSAVLGGMPVSFSRGRSLGSLAIGGKGALAGVLAYFICGGLYLAGEVPVAFLPRFVLEGMLIFFGLALIRDWMFKVRSAFYRRDDTLVMMLVFFMTILLGVVIGIGFGVAFGALMSIRRYSRDGGVRGELSGAVFHSNVDRSPAQARVLREVGEHVHVVSLRGFVFLGTMQDMVERIRERTLDQEKLDVEYLIVDFGKVSGFASFSNLGFGMLRNLALDEELNVIFTRVPFELEEYLAKSGFAINDMEGSFRIFINLDYALEWCEERLLEAEGMTSKTQGTLVQMLGPAFADERYAQALVKVMKRIDASDGDVLFRQGDPSDTMYFVESGSLEVELQKDGRRFRLKKVGPGAVVGEMGIYTEAPRTATVKAAERTVLYMLTRDKLHAVERKVPKLATALDRYLINLLSDRLSDANLRGRELI